MQIQVSTDNNIDGSDNFVSHVEEELTAALARFSDRLTRVEIHLADESAGRSTGADKRCMLEARPAGRAPVAVTDYAETVQGAIRGATDKLVNLLNSETGRMDDRKGGTSIRGGQSD